MPAIEQRDGEEIDQAQIDREHRGKHDQLPDADLRAFAGKIADAQHAADLIGWPDAGDDLPDALQHLATDVEHARDAVIDRLPHAELDAIGLAGCLDPAPPRSTPITISWSRLSCTNSAMSLKSSIAVPFSETMRSPDCNPALAAADPASASPITGAATSLPWTAKITVKISAANR